MKPGLVLLIIFFSFTCIANAQESEKRNSVKVPSAVRSALQTKYPEATRISWEKEKGNYEANWGGKSGEDNSVQFTPAGAFIEIVKVIPVNELPKKIMVYVKEHYKNAAITEAGKLTDAAGKESYEAEVKGNDIIFDQNGNFIRSEK